MIALKLLVVEDEPASLELITEVFTSLEAEVRPVSDSMVQRLPLGTSIKKVFPTAFSGK